MIGGGIRAGFNELQALGGSAVAAVGKVRGNEGLEQWGAETAAKNFEEASQFGRPDLETPPWREGGGAVLPWLGYQAAKQVPQVLGGAAIGAATGGAGLAAAVGGRAALGAATGAAGASARGAATQAVKQMTRQQAKTAASRGAAGGLFATGATVGAGSMYSEAVERGNPTREDAARALALSPIYGAVEAVPQALIGKTLVKGGKSASIARRVTGGALMGAATEGPTEAVQTAMENTFRPDLSTEEKAQRIVDAAATGAAVGGSFSAAGNVRRAKDTAPQETSDEALAAAVDEAVTPASAQAPQPQAPTEAAPQGTLGLDDPTQAAQPRPYADLEPAQLVEAVERTVPMAANPQVGVEQQEQAAQVLAQLRAEIITRQDTAPAADLGDVQLGEQAEIAQAALAQAADPVEIETTQARLFEINEESNRRQETRDQELSPVLPGFDPGTVQPLTEQEQTQAQLRRDEKREVRLARQAIRSQDETATPSKEAERLGLTPYTEQEFSQRVDATRERMRTVAQEVEQARAERQAMERDPATTQETKKRADSAVTKAEKNLQGAIKEGREATRQVRLRDRVLKRVEEAQGSLDAIQERPVETEPETPTTAPDRARDPVGDLFKSETPKQRTTRRKNMSDAGITDTSRFRVQTPDSDAAPIEVSWPEMLDPKILADRLQGLEPGETIAQGRERGAIGVVSSRQAARQVANRVSKAARRGQADFNDAARGFNVNFTPAATQPAALETPTLQTTAVPPSTGQQAAQTTGTGAPTTPSKAVFNPASLQRQERAQEQAPTLEAIQETAPAGSAVTRVQAPPQTRVQRPSTPQENQTAIGRVMQALGRSVQEMFTGDYLAMAPRVRKEALAWLDMQSIQGRFSNAFDTPWLTQLRDQTNKKKAIIGYFSARATEVSDKFEKLDTAVQDKIMELQELVAYDISYAMPWSEHTHLQGHPDEAFLQGVHEKATDIYNSIQPNGGRKVIDDFADLNRSMILENQIRRLHSQLETDFSIQNRQDFDTVVGRRGYDTIRRKQIREPRKMVAELRKDRAELLDIADTIIQAKNADAQRAGISPVEQNRLLIMSDMLSQTTALVRDEAESDGMVPYFHKGRFGDYRVSFELAQATDADGNAVSNAENEQVLADALAAQGITGVGIQENGPSRSVMMKFETQADANAAFDVAQRLEARGIVVDPSKGGEVMQSMPESVTHQFKEGLVDFLGSMTAMNQDDDVAARNLSEQRALIEKYFLETTPANSNRRVLAHRRNVHGYSRDMHRAFVHRWQIGLTDTANAITAAPKAKIYRGMRDEARDTKNMQDNRTFVQTDTLNEMRQRDQVVDIKPNSLTGSIRAVNHAWYLGMSPAYMLMTIAHVPIITLPKLGARFGFAKASSQLLGAAPEAAQVLRLLVRNSMNAKNFGEATFTNLSPEILRNEFLKYDDQGRPTQESENFVGMLLELAETSTIDMGGQMRELGRVAEGRDTSKLDQILRVYGAPGFYSEVYSRLVTGIATYRMQTEAGMTGADRIKETANMIHETMLDYSSGNIGRRTGEKGFAGSVTPIVTAFQQYSFQVLGMLYREYHKLYTHNEPSPARRAEARKFLAGHLAAVTVFAGTMGLPFASAASRAVEALANLLFVDENEEPLDLDTAYRNYLADTFGQDMGEVLARGVPRSMGMDLSTRLGEQDLLPFSRLLSDRRFLLDSAGTMDAISDAAMRRLGAPVGVPASLAEAVPQLLSGDIINASAQGAPVALSSVFKAYKMTQDGYTDRNGNPLSITPTGLDVLNQAIGISPARKAEESAASNALRVSTMRANARKNVIRNQVGAAVRSGDGEAAREWMAEAMAYDVNNPGKPMTPTLMQTIGARFEKSAVAQLLGVPRGMDIDDPAAWELVRFRNSN